MDKLRKVLRVCMVGFRKILISPRFYLAFLWVYFSFAPDIGAIRSFCGSVGKNCSPWIFALLTENSSNQLFIILGALFLFCDAPFLHANSGWQILRAGRSNWFLGNMLYIWLLSFLYSVGVGILPIVSILPMLEWDTGWGKILGSLAQTSAASQFGMEQFNYAIIVQHSPMDAMALTIISVWLNVVLIGVCNYVFNFYLKKGTGSVVSVVLGLSPLLIVRLAKFSTGYYFSPPLWMSLANYKWKEYGYGVSFGYAYGVLIGLILLCMIFSWKGICKKDLNFSDEV